nr:MAG TPA: hypothetical protein [Caudoviricetes sp.]
MACSTICSSPSVISPTIWAYMWLFSSSGVRNINL